MGIVLNNPSDMLNTAPGFNTTPFDLGGQWQIFIQAYHDPTVGGDPADFGGAEVWMGQCYANLPFVQYGPNNFYSDSQWSALVAGLNNPSLITGGTVALHAGDVVAVTSGGLEYEGMENMNQEHYIDGPMVLTVLETGATLPAPTATTLGQLMDSNGKFYFDATRQTGAEHLQGTLVQLQGVRVLSGTWAPGKDVVVTDGSLRQMELQIGVNSNLTVAPTGTFNVTGIEDQESTDYSSQDGYTLWLTDSANVTALPNSGGTFNWSGSGSSWNGPGSWNPSGKPQNPGDVAILGGSLAVAATVTLDGPQKAGGLIFANTNSSSSGYALSPGGAPSGSGTLTLDNSGSAAFLTVMSGSHAIAAPLTIADDLDVGVAVGGSLALSGGIREESKGLALNEQGGGLLVLGGTNDYTGGTFVSGGTLLVQNAAAIADGTSLTVGDASAFGDLPQAVSTLSAAAPLNPVPEPCTPALLAAALAGLLFRRRKVG
jgi:autotransporter-associated beta strand protein